MIGPALALALAITQWPGLYNLRRVEADVWEPDAVTAAPLLPSIGVVSVDAVGLVATVAGVAGDAASMTWSIAPAVGAGTCVIIGNLFTCVVVRPAISATTQTLTLTAINPSGQRVLSTSVNFL